MEQDWPKMKIVLCRIERELKITSPNEPCEIYDNAFGIYIKHREIEKAFRRLEYDKVIQILERPEQAKEDGTGQKDKYVFKVLPAFEKYKEKIEQSDSDTEKPIYEIKYNDTDSTVALNDFVLCKPNYESATDRLIKHLCKNPNRKITADEIDKQCFSDSPRTQELKSIIQNLGLKGQARDAFFRISKTSIYFRNPVYQKDLDELGIKKLNYGNK